MPDDPSIPAAVRELSLRLALPRPMRRGSLGKRFVKCSKPGCRCSHDSAARHGPYFSLVRTVAGRTQSRWVAADDSSLMRQQIEAGAQFRKDVAAFWGACERWADAELEAKSAAAEESAKKNASKRPSPKSSSKRSKPS